MIPGSGFQIENERVELMVEVVLEGRMEIRMMMTRTRGPEFLERFAGEAAGVSVRKKGSR